jgi:hypothetical protein
MPRRKKMTDEFLESDQPTSGAKKLAEGERVKFFGSHDKSHQFTGTIVRVHEDSDLVDIATEPDGKAIEIETILTAHATDVTPVEE